MFLTPSLVVKPEVQRYLHIPAQLLLLSGGAGWRKKMSTLKTSVNFRRAQASRWPGQERQGNVSLSSGSCLPQGAPREVSSQIRIRTVLPVNCDACVAPRSAGFQAMWVRPEETQPIVTSGKSQPSGQAWTSDTSQEEGSEVCVAAFISYD